MLKFIKRVFPIVTIFLFTVYYISKILIPNFIYFGEEKGFINYDYVNFRYTSLWSSTVNFGKAINAEFFNIFTTGTFWKIGQSIGLSPTVIQWWFYFIFIGLTLLFTYFVLNHISKNRLLSLLLSLIYVTTIMYYSSSDTSPKIIHFLLLPSGIFLWLKYYESSKARFLILNAILLIATLSIGINPPQLIGAYSFIFLYIFIFSTNRKTILKTLLFIAPYLINIMFVFLVNLLYIKNIGTLVKYNLFEIGSISPSSLIHDVLRLFGAWWDYVGASGLPYNDAAWYYHSPLGIVLTYIPFFILLMLLLFDKKSARELKIKILAVFIIALFMVKGVEPPFNIIFNSIYKNNIFKIFREPWAKFMPNFIVTVLLGIAYLSRNVSKKILTLELLLIAFFFLFQLYPIASNIIIRTRDVDWKMQDVKVPAYWYDVEKWSKKFAKNKRILILPAISNNTYNMYPTYYNWKPFPFYGNAPLLFLYSDLIQNEYMDPENAYITKNIVEKINPQLILSLSIDYVIYQNDLVPKPKNVKPYLSTVLPALETQNKTTIGKVDIYPVNKSLRQPKIRTVNKVIYTNNPCQTYIKKTPDDQTVIISSNSKRQSQINLNQVPYVIQMISPTKYHVNFLKTANTNIGLLFMETFNNGWTIKGATQHSIGDCFANFWLLPKNVVNKKGVDIVYSPQTIFTYLIGLFIFFHVLFLFLSLLRIKLHLTSNWLDSVIQPLAKFINAGWLFLKKVRLILLIYLLFFVLNKIFPFTLPGDFNGLVFILLWIIVVIQYQFPILINYYTTVFLAIAMIYVRLLVNYQYAEIVAGWFTIFLLIDLLHLLILNVYDYKPRISINTLPAEMLNDLYSLKNSTIAIFLSINNTLKRRLELVDNRFVKATGYLIIDFLNVLLRIIKLVFKITISYIEKTLVAYKRDRILFAKRVLFVILIVVFIRTADFQINHYFERLTRNPKIYSIEPHIVYRSTKVILRGYNLGWKPDNAALRLYSSYGEVQKDFWSDSEIIFTVPLSWKDGMVKLWVEKPINWDGKNFIAKSDIITIKLIPSSSTFTPADDEFFKQLKNLDKETLRINGYE